MPALILGTESLAPPMQTLPPSPPGLLHKKTVRTMRSAATARTVLSDARNARRESAGSLTGSEENHRSMGANTQSLIFLRIHPVTRAPSPSVHTFTNNPISFNYETSGPSQTHHMALELFLPCSEKYPIFQNRPPLQVGQWFGCKNNKHKYISFLLHTKL